MPTFSPSVSVVVPCYNEEPVIDLLLDRLTRVCENLGEHYEIVLVNDGSRDATWERMSYHALQHAHLLCVNLSRNHGHQLALTAGLSVCQGDRVFVIDADLQDPPEALPEMLALMDREAADVVYGLRSSRNGETWFKKITAHLFYRTLGWLAESSIPRDTGDFRLMTRRVVEQFLAMPERHRFVRGMISWIGFRQVPYHYERAARAAGETHYTFAKMMRFAWDAVTGFSTRPLKLAFHAGTFCLLAAMVTLTSAVVWWLNQGAIPTAGFLAALIFSLSGGQFLTLGIIGEYLGRMYSEVRGRPLFVIDQVIRSSVVEQVLPSPSPRREVA